jgi:hypothetical protein
MKIDVDKDYFLIFFAPVVLVFLGILMSNEVAVAIANWAINIFPFVNNVATFTPPENLTNTLTCIGFIGYLLSTAMFLSGPYVITHNNSYYPIDIIIVEVIRKWSTVFVFLIVILAYSSHISGKESQSVLLQFVYLCCEIVYSLIAFAILYYYLIHPLTGTKKIDKETGFNIDIYFD